MSAISEILWKVLRADPSPRTLRALAEECGAKQGSVYCRMKHLVRNGLVVMSPGHTPTYTLADPATAPAQVPAFTRGGQPVVSRVSNAVPLWAAIRAMSKRGPFDIPMLTMVAGTTDAAATNYINRLRRAGYIRLIADQWRGKPASYLLIRDTGPRAPRVTQRRGSSTLRDLNTGKRIDISPGRISLRQKPCVAAADGGVG